MLVERGRKDKKMAKREEIALYRGGIEKGCTVALMHLIKQKGKMRMSRQKLVPTDGLGPKEIKRIRGVLRQVWYQCHARRLVIKRCTGKDGFARCEKCGKKIPHLKVDHITPVGDVDGGFIARLFCPSKKLQGMCKKCHDAKTREERKACSSVLCGWAHDGH
jgi:hypothetical protein